MIARELIAVRVKCTPLVSMFKMAVAIHNTKQYNVWPSETVTQKNQFCDKTKKATKNPRSQMKSSCRGASTGVVAQAPFLFFGNFFEKKKKK